jgi:hypothetical protein
MNKKIVLIMEITDQETVDGYIDVCKELILEDIAYGTLGEQLEIVSKNIVEFVI